MSMQTGQQAPVNGNTPPPVAADPDAGRYEELRKELGIEAEAQEAEPQPEPQREPEPQQEPARAKPEHVPYTEHENVQKALKEARAAQKASDERFSQLMRIVEDARGKRPAAAEEVKKEEPALPDKMQDPIGHYDARIAQLEKQLQEARQGTQQTAEQINADRQMRQFHDVVVRSEHEINDPKSPNHKADYWDAVGYLEAQRVRELERMYPDSSPYVMQMAQQHGLGSAQELRQFVLNQDRQNVALQALQMGIPPAEFYYQLAQDRGYQAKPAGQQQRAPNGQFAPAEKAQQQIEATKRGRNASVSISGDSGGRKGAKDMSLTDLSELYIEDADEADKVWEQMRRQGLLG